MALLLCENLRVDADAEEVPVLGLSEPDYDAANALACIDEQQDSTVSGPQQRTAAQRYAAVSA